MLERLAQPWPWYVAGPLIGLMVPALLLVGNRLLGISSNLRHACAAVAPGRAEYFRYDWKATGGWNLAFAVGILVGGFIGGVLLAGPETVAIAAETRAELAALGITDFSGLVPDDLFSLPALFTLKGFLAVVVGGFLVGFGAAYAGGCTSGHAISGLADLQPASLIAVIGFFVGGLVITHVVLPLVL
ncbi:MAG: YeeE/YedE family protein [Gemmatimonadota bacterium]